MIYNIYSPIAIMIIAAETGQYGSEAGERTHAYLARGSIERRWQTIHQGIA